jgi:predicted phosphodiesterase
MKIAYGSDIHLEIRALEINNTEDAKVLVLAGDICTVTDLDSLNDIDIGYFRSQRIHNFFKDCCDKFEKVIYIMGNHEHYHHQFYDTIGRLKTNLGYLPNLHILDREVITIAGTTFICGTLWSDMNNEDPATKEYMLTRMNDFRIIKNGMVKFSPNDAILEHRRMLKFIWDIVGEGDYVVVGHHSPSFRSVSKEFEKDKLMNGGFHSNLEEFITNRPQIKVWIHGHTHSAHDYMLGETRVVCNPRGYAGYEAIADTFELKYIDI